MFFPFSFPLLFCLLSLLLLLLLLFSLLLLLLLFIIIIIIFIIIIIIIIIIFIIIKETDESTLENDSSVPLTQHDLSDLGSKLLNAFSQKKTPLVKNKIATLN